MLARTIALLFLAMLYVSAVAAQPSARTASDLSFGNPRAEHRIEAYYDFQCGACATFHEGLKKVIERFPGKVYVVIRHYPLPMHDQAFMASTVVEVANRHGKGWEMIELVLNGQQRWSTAKRPFSVVFEYAKQLGLDEKQFRADLQSDDVARSVLLDLHRAKRLGVGSTPTAFLDGRLLTYPESLDLEDIISKR